MATESVSTNTAFIIPRVSHICVSIANRMLVWGGYTETGYVTEHYLEPNLVFDYSTEYKYWTVHETSGDIPPGTSGAGACVMPSLGCLFVFAGHTYDGNTNRLYSLDLKTLNWTNLKPDDPQVEESWPSPRDKFCCWTYEGRFFCFGGYGIPVNRYLNDSGKFRMDATIEGKGWNNQVLEYNTRTGRWTNPVCKGELPLPRAAGAAVRFGSEVYLFGGRFDETRMNDLHCLNLENYTWSGELHMEGAVPCGRSWHTLEAVSHNIAFLYGGFTTDCEVLDDGWLLDVTSRQWTQVTVPPGKPRLWHTCCITEDHEILVFGGCKSNILDHTATHNILSNEVLRFRIQPWTLQRLCLEAAFAHRDKLTCLWSTLPRDLQDWLEHRTGIQKVLNSASSDSISKTATSCALS